MRKYFDPTSIPHPLSGLVSYVLVNYDRCSSCGACVPICPPGSVTLQNATLQIDAFTCTGCFRCIYICPTGALSRIQDHENGV